MTPRIQIAGRPEDEEAAAVVAVIAALLEEEESALATPTQAPRQSSWVLAWRPRDIPTPLPSHTFDARPWSELDSAEPGEVLE